MPLLYGSGYLYNVSPEAYKQIMSQDGMDIHKPVEGLTLEYGVLSSQRLIVADPHHPAF